MTRLDANLKERYKQNRIFGNTDHEKELNNEILKFENHFTTTAFNSEQLDYYNHRVLQYEQLCTQQYTKFLQSDNMPSWLVTGRGNYNFNKFNKQQERQMSLYKNTEERKMKFITNTKKKLKTLVNDTQRDDSLVRFFLNEKEQFTWHENDSLYSHKGKISTSYKNSFVGRLTTRIKNDNCQKKAEELFYSHDLAKHFTKRHKIYDLFVEKEQSQVENQTFSMSDLTIKYNYDEDRIQLFFDDKPEKEFRQKLVRSAFKWSPTKVTWQRKLTNNAVIATRSLLEVDALQLPYINSNN